MGDRVEVNRIKRPKEQMSGEDTTALTQGIVETSYYNIRQDTHHYRVTNVDYWVPENDITRLN